MQLDEFREQIINHLSSLEYVEDIEISEIQEGSFTGQAKIKVKYILNIRFKFFKGILTLSFAIIYKDNRIWGLDKDNKIGWHIHPLMKVMEHEKISEKSVQEIIELIDSVCSHL